MKLIALLEDSDMPTEEFRRRVNKVFLALQQMLLDKGLEDADIKSDRIYGLRLRVKAKTAEKAAEVVLRLERRYNRDDKFTGVYATLSGHDFFYRSSEALEQEWDSELNVQELAADLYKYVMRKATPKEDKWYRRGTLRELAQKYHARFDGDVKLDGRDGIALNALKSNKRLSVYVAKPADHPNGAHAGYMYTDDRLSPRATLKFLESTEELKELIKQWVKDNP